MSDGGTIRYGIHPLLEAEANELIFGSLKGVTSQSAKSDILTPWKEHDRRAREVLAFSGVVDPATRLGIYGRAANTVQTHLNSREGVARGTISQTKTALGDSRYDEGWEADE
jgi:hypothetical protein